jgi:hypothetical protein
MNRQKFITIMTLVLTITFQSNFCLSDDTKQKYADVRLQKNKWVQIIEQKEEIGYKEYAKGEVWELHVKILFLQYCKASKKKSRFKELIKDPNATSQEIGKAFAEEVANPDFTVPMFRCNYRTTIFLTLYSSDGTELETMKTIPVAPKNKTEIIPGETIWATFVRTIDPTYRPPPKSWHVWVPK